MSPASPIVYNRNNPEDARKLCRKPIDIGERWPRPPSQGNVWDEQRSIDSTLELEYANGRLPWRSRLTETERVRAPANRLRWGTLGNGIMVGNEKQRHVPLFSCWGSGSPPEK